MNKRLLIIFLLIIPVMVSAQRRNRYKYEFIMGLGASNFLGELGGANQVGTNFLKDFEFSATRPSAMIGVRYKNARYFGFKSALYFGMLNGNDNLTTEPFRHNRNLHFRSPIVEFSGQLEGYITKEQQGHLYRIKNAKGMKHIDMQIYGFIGIGAFYFNPQAFYAGSWVNLQPLGTEGQGLISGHKKYSRINVAVPIGIGFKYALDRKWSLGLEYGIRKTFTDYIDDVSTVYYRDTTGSWSPAQTYLADPSLGEIQLPDGIEVTQTGQQRGDSKDKDAYMFAHVTVSYKFIYRRKTRSKF
jgi:hypothetical protein